MDKTFASARLASDTRGRALISYLDENQQNLRIDSGTLYYDFPLFQDSNERLHRAGILLAARSHGVVLFATVPSADEATLLSLDEDLSQLQSIIFGKCLQSRILRRSQRDLIFPVTGFLVAAGLDAAGAGLENDIITALNQIPGRFIPFKLDPLLSTDAWNELRSILEGTKAIIRPKPSRLLKN